MKLTILETGLPPAPLQSDWPRYPAMFEALISPHSPGLVCESLAISQGAPFPALEDVEAILVTGSAAGVYEDHPWMQPLFDFIRKAGEANIPQIGVCFGHQAIAKAMGARVEKAEKGWGIGRHVYEVCTRPDWMDGFDGTHFALGVSHQDQVLSRPEGAERVAASSFTPFAALDYGDMPAISFQGHPEFSAGFCRALYDVRRGTAFPEAFVEQASRSLETPVDNDLVGQWMGRFLNERVNAKDFMPDH